MDTAAPPPNNAPVFFFYRGTLWFALCFLYILGYIFHHNPIAKQRPKRAQRAHFLFTITVQNV